MTPQTIFALAQQCDGWSIKCPKRMRELGLPDSVAKSLEQCFESNPTEYKQTVFVNGRITNQLFGIYSLDLLRWLAESIDADLSGVVATGRGTQAEQMKTAIRHKIERGLA